MKAYKIKHTPTGKYISKDHYHPVAKGDIYKTLRGARAGLTFFKERLIPVSTKTGLVIEEFDLVPTQTVVSSTWEDLQHEYYKYIEEGHSSSFADWLMKNFEPPTRKAPDSPSGDGFISTNYGK